MVARLSRRQARRRWGRTLAIVLTLALPVLGLTAFDVVQRSTRLSPDQTLERQLGPAQALIQWLGGQVTQGPNPDLEGWSPQANGIAGPQANHEPAAPPEPVPAGLRLSPVVQLSTGFATSKGQAYGELFGENLTDPVLASLVRLQRGHLPDGPREVALTPAAARSVGGLGSLVSAEVDPGQPLLVVGIVAERYHPADKDGFVGEGTGLALATHASDQGPSTISWFASGPPVTWPDVLQLNGRGWYVASAYAAHHHPPGAGPSDRLASPDRPLGVRILSSLTAAVVAAAIALEVILLAGPAFAVGARQRERELAALAAVGATRRQLAGVVLGDGVTVGLLAGLFGVVAGGALGAAALAVDRHLGRSVPGAVRLEPLDLFGIGLIAVVIAALSSLRPALAAGRRPPAETLRGYPVPVAPRRRSWVSGAVCLAAALVATLPRLHSGVEQLVFALAALLSEIGLVLLTPGLLHLALQAAGRIPLWTRMAVRDAARRRTAAVPAVAAITAVVAAGVASMLVVAATGAHNASGYWPTAPRGDAVIFPPTPWTNNSAPPSLASLQARLRGDLPGRAVVALETVGPDSSSCQAGCEQTFIKAYPPPTCGTAGVPFAFDTGYVGYATYGAAKSCGHVEGYEASVPLLVVTPGGLQQLLGGTAGARAAALLRTGTAVASSPWYVHHGEAEGTVASPAQANPAAVPPPPGLGATWQSWRAAVVPSANALFAVAVTPAMAAPLAPFRTSAIVVADASRAPLAQRQHAAADVVRLGSSWYVERGQQNPLPLELLAIVAVNLLFGVAAVVAAVALIGADAGPDLLTLAAVGAGPSGRRRLAMARAGVLATVGVFSGAAAGIVGGLLGTRRWLEHEAIPLSYLTVPWQVVLVVVGLPALAAAMAACTRSQLPSERRQA
jgi:putative ABC transport system permease protein